MTAPERDPRDDDGPADAADAPAGGAEGPEEVDERPSKGRVARRERGERAYSETYGRGGGEQFDREDHPHAYGAPDGLDWRRALRAYVRGHDRGWEADRKYDEAGREAAAASAPPRREAPERHPAPEAGGAPADEATAETERGTRFGVGVPDRGDLTFHRSASTWRERLPEAPRLPRHADRELDGRRGRGNQA